MKRLALMLACALALIVAGVSVRVGPDSARAIAPTLMTSGDSALAAAGSFKIYPFFTLGGAHMHSPELVFEGADPTAGTINGYQQAARGFLFSSASQLRVNVYGPAGVDSSGFTVPAGGSMTALPTCDSVLVLNTGGSATTVTWGLIR